MTDSGRPGMVAGDAAERSWSFRARALFRRHEWLRGYTLLSPTLLVMYRTRFLGHKFVSCGGPE